jgi:Fe-S-cluster-containing dehydrogenase component
MGKILILDINKCNGCYSCQIACKDEHVGNDWTPIAKPQPDTGHFWNKITDMVRGTVPKVKMTYLHDICQHCENAPCMATCKVEGAIYKRKDGLVIIDPIKCSGCKNCVDACPYKVIYFNDGLNIAQKCTGCAHLLDRGWKEPRCVDVCPTGAMKFGEEEDLQELVAKAELLRPDLDVKPRVYYVGLPKKFVAGAVYDPEIDECIEGAIATLTDLKAGEKVTAMTDNFGDFWLKDLGIGTYSLSIEKDGYFSRKIEPVSTQNDINVGDIKLHKKK